MELNLAETVLPLEDHGWFWASCDVETVKLDGRWYVLYGWNGEKYTNCWVVLDSDGLDESPDDKRRYPIRPVYTEVDEDEWELQGYVIGYPI